MKRVMCTRSDTVAKEAGFSLTNSLYGSAPEANKRAGVVKFGIGDKHTIVFDGQHLITIKFPTAISTVNLNSGEISTSFNIVLTIHPDLTEYAASFLVSMSRLTLSEAEHILSNLIGKSYEEALSFLRQLVK